MPKKPSIATQDEILKHFTEIMRSTPEDGVKINESLSAGEKLYKMLREKKSDEADERTYGVVILPEIKEEDEE